MIVTDKYMLPHIIPEISEWPISKLSDSRRQFIKEIDQYTFKKIKELYPTIHGLADLIAKIIYLEKIRMKEEPWKVDPPKEKIFWKKIRSNLQAIDLNNTPEAEALLHELLEKIINRYSEEIVGTFNKKTFLFARKFLRFFFKTLLKSSTSFLIKRSPKSMDDHLLAMGKVDSIRNLFKKGIVVIVPTHFSNLDSILIGYAIDTFVGLPSFSYGAGLNLYNSGYTAYFMNRLGAYRVDRRKKNPIYLETLKTMSNLSIQRGTNSLFFPGGTRSRSGEMESKFKLGLLGTVVEAQRNLAQSKKNDKIFVVPLILSYHFVLEAQFLVESYLKNFGKEKYLFGKDEFNSFRKILKFTWLIFSKRNEILLSFGQPMDVLGNPVNDNGESYSPDGKLIDVNKYFNAVNGSIQSNLQSESEFTKILADRIIERYKIDNIILTSHLVAFITFLIFKEQNKRLDLYGLLQLPVDDFSIKISTLVQNINIALNYLRKMEAGGHLQLSPKFKEDEHNIIDDGIKRLGSYHVKKPLIIKGDTVKSENFKLLFYYHNRLSIYQLERHIDLKI
jgi:glycerol-3-phosphate O-acyltransferase